MKWLRLIKFKLPKLKKESIREALLIVGFFSFCYGIWQIYPPAAYIAGGMMVMYFAAP